MTVPVWLKPFVMATLLASLWTWEALRPARPLFDARRSRFHHAARNLAVTVGNAVVLALLFSTATVGVISWAESHQFGLLRWLHQPDAIEWLAAIVLLDGWLYVWHRANHAIPWLWRFHRMHHSDHRMDVTTATRFHLGEHILSSMLRLGLLPVLGFTLSQVAVFDILVIANTQIHHANISLGRWDPWLRLLIVTPAMHKLHHSDRRPETDSNYSVLFSLWDRLARSFVMRDEGRALQFGLREFDAPEWQRVSGMLRTPFVNVDVTPVSPQTGSIPSSKD